MNWLQKLSQQPWEMSEDEFVDFHNTGYISPDSYTQTSLGDMQKWAPDKDKYPILLTTMQFGDLEVGFRQTGEENKYVKQDTEGEIVRDEQGMALYLSEEEMLARGLPLHSETIGFFVGDIRIGWIGDSFGATELFVADEFKNRGIGSTALKMWLEMYPRRRKKPMGQMTPAGEGALRKTHRMFTDEMT